MSQPNQDDLTAEQYSDYLQRKNLTQSLEIGIANIKFWNSFMLGPGAGVHLFESADDAAEAAMHLVTGADAAQQTFNSIVALNSQLEVCMKHSARVINSLRVYEAKRKLLHPEESANTLFSEAVNVYQTMEANIVTYFEMALDAHRGNMQGNIETGDEMIEQARKSIDKELKKKAKSEKKEKAAVKKAPKKECPKERVKKDKKEKKEEKKSKKAAIDPLDKENEIIDVDGGEDYSTFSPPMEL